MFWFKQKNTHQELIEQEDAEHAEAPVNETEIQSILLETLENQTNTKFLEDILASVENEICDLEQLFKKNKKQIIAYIIAKCPLVLVEKDWTGLIGKRTLEIGNMQAGIYYYYISNAYTEMVFWIQGKQNKISESI